MSSTPAVERAARAGSLGHTRLAPEQRRELAAAVESDPDARVRAVSLGALVRSGPRRAAASAWRAAASDRDASVRRRAAELAPALGVEVPARCLVELLADDDPLVAEAAAFALGEHPRAGARRRSPACDAPPRPTPTRSCARPPSPRWAPGATRATRAVVLAACDDKPAVRRRAVLALAAFEARSRGTAASRARGPRLAGAPGGRGPARRRSEVALSRAGRSAP